MITPAPPDREIELKFTVADRATFLALLRAPRLGGYPASPALVEEQENRYLDTADRRLLGAGYALRLRRVGGRCTVCLKGPGEVSGALHRRVELSLELPGTAAFSPRPDSELGRLVRRLAADAPLVELFRAHTTRRARQLSRHGQPFAEAAVDRVRVAAGGRTLEFSELEVEIFSAADQPCLERLAAALVTAYRLVPGTETKFARGLAFVDRFR